MKYDEIIKKKKTLNDIVKQSNIKDEKYNKGLKEGVEKSLDLFNSIIDFYLMYKDDVKKLMKEQNKLWNKWIIYYNDQNNIDISNYLNSYNKWLFNNIFINIKEDENLNLLELY